MSTETLRLAPSPERRHCIADHRSTVTFTNSAPATGLAIWIGFGSVAVGGLE